MNRRDFLATAAFAGLARGETQGRYFAKKSYTGSRLPTFEETKGQLPSPIYEPEPAWIEVYWKAWELAFRNFYEPTPANGLVSQFIDAAFSGNIFLWDTCFMSMFCNYAHPLAPGIESLDNFYCKQHADGEICREIERDSGRDFAPWVNVEHAPLASRGARAQRSKRGPVPVKYIGQPAPSPNPVLMLDGLNHPIAAWAELESYRVTGDRQRLGMVWPPLERFFSALRTYLRQGNGLYTTDWASMDNSPRNSWIEEGGTAVDTSSEMCLFARNLAQIARILGQTEKAADLDREADSIAHQIELLMWDEGEQFYFDLNAQGHRSRIRTIAAYWTLLAGAASSMHARALVSDLKNPKTFGLRNAVPTCAASEPDYNPAGGYWRGAVWPPTTTMVIRGLEKHGYHELARDLAINHLQLVAEVFQKTGSIWENYAPDSADPGKPAKKDLVGWSGIGPIMYLLEYGIGLRPDAGRNELTWRMPGGFRAGCRNYRFNGHVVSLVAVPEGGKSDRVRVQVSSDSTFRLVLLYGRQKRRMDVAPGSQSVYVVG